jgi:hypothetical protein
MRIRVINQLKPSLLTPLVAFEAKFTIAKNSVKGFQFRFNIELHKDDRSALNST